MGKALGVGEEIALAIIAATRDNTEPLRELLKKLKSEGWDDYQIGNAFMDVGRVVFNPGDDYPELEESEDNEEEEI
jgi:hypothetical protein